MYAKTNLGTGRMSRRQKRAFAVIGVLVVLVVGGLATWGALRPDNYATSANGCVNLTMPGSMGGETFHYCGSAARTFWQDMVRSRDQGAPRGRAPGGLGGGGAQ